MAFWDPPSESKKKERERREGERERKWRKKGRNERIGGFLNDTRCTNSRFTYLLTNKRTNRSRHSTSRCWWYSNKNAQTTLVSDGHQLLFIGSFTDEWRRRRLGNYTTEPINKSPGSDVVPLKVLSLIGNRYCHHGRDDIPCDQLSCPVKYTVDQVNKAMRPAAFHSNQRQSVVDVIVFISNFSAGLLATDGRGRTRRPCLSYLLFSFESIRPLNSPISASFITWKI